MEALNDNNLLIDYEKVLDNSKNIKTCAKRMDDILNSFTNRITELKKWEIIKGKSADALEESNSSFRKNFDMYIKTVCSFSEMIENAANETLQTEKSLASEAANLPK